MTTTVLRHSHSPIASGVSFGQVLANVRHMATRARDRRMLATLDSRMLADIGVTREQAIAESKKAFWQA
jgi:uncharacterized protein YjiS (DUF1127 family)